MVLGTFMSILDTTIVNVAINDLAREFNATLPTIQWVSTGYMLALATVIPLTGYFADRFGTKRSTWCRSRYSWPAHCSPAPPGRPSR